MQFYNWSHVLINYIRSNIFSFRHNPNHSRQIWAHNPHNNPYFLLRYLEDTCTELAWLMFQCRLQLDLKKLCRITLLIIAYSPWTLWSSIKWVNHMKSAITPWRSCGVCSILNMRTEGGLAWATRRAAEKLCLCARDAKLSEWLSNCLTPSLFSNL